jgi:hypothetical protein
VMNVRLLPSRKVRDERERPERRARGDRPHG